jgi:hypothetical protein
MSKIDFTSSDFLFVSKPDQYYIEGHPVQCDSDCTEWKEDKLIEDGWGFFNGLTMVSYRGYDGELPRMDGDTSAYEEFNITYKGILINEMTYRELQNLILADSRDMKIDSLNGL